MLGLSFISGWDSGQLRRSTCKVRGMVGLQKRCIEATSENTSVFCLTLRSLPSKSCFA